MPFSPAAFCIIDIDKGASFNRTIAFEVGDPLAPYILTGCTAVWYFYSTGLNRELYEEWTTENGKLSIDGPAGTISTHITKEYTAARTWENGEHGLYVQAPDSTTRDVYMYGPAHLRFGGLYPLGAA